MSRTTSELRCECDNPQPDRANDRGLACASCGRLIWPRPDIHGWDRKPENLAKYRSLVLRTIRMQAEDLRVRKMTDCGDCGRMLFQDDRSYRCFHCDVIFCNRCARKHFGQTMRVNEGGEVVTAAELETARCNMEVLDA